MIRTRACATANRSFLMTLSIVRYGHAYDAFKLLLMGEEDIWEGMDVDEPLKVSNVQLRLLGSCWNIF